MILPFSGLDMLCLPLRSCGATACASWSAVLWRAAPRYCPVGDLSPTAV